MNPALRAALEHPRGVIVLALVLEAAAALIGFGTGIDALQALTRYSGRAGLFLFAGVFLVSPWNTLFPSPASRLALKCRRRMGLAFGWHHLVHLGILLFYLHESGKELNAGRAAGGMVGYVFLVAMMATSNNAAVKRLGPVNWRRLHRTGLWYLWVVFVLTYVPRLQGKVPGAGGGRGEFIACLLVLALLAAARIFAFVVRRRRLGMAASLRGGNVNAD